MDRSEQMHRETNFHLQEFPCHLLTWCGMSKWDVGWTATAVTDYYSLLMWSNSPCSRLCLPPQAKSLIVCCHQLLSDSDGNIWFSKHSVCGIKSCLSVHVVLFFFFGIATKRNRQWACAEKAPVPVGTDKEQTTYRHLICGRKCNSNDFSKPGERDGRVDTKIN